MTLNSTAKRILVALLITAITVLIALVMVFLFVANPPTLEETPTQPGAGGVNGLTPADQTGGFGFNIEDLFDRITNTPTPTVPSVAQGGSVITAQLTTSRIVSPVLTGGDQIQFYEPKDGKFYTIGPSGEISAVSDAVFPAAEAVTFSDNGAVAALEFPDGSNIIYDIKNDKQTTLPSHWDDFEFSTDGSELISKSLGVGSSLVVTNSDGTQARVISDLGDNASEVKLNWSPSGETVAFSETGTAQSVFGRQEIFLISPTGEATGTLIVDGTNFSAKWSPAGKSLLYSVADQQRNERPALWFVNSTGSEIGAGRTNLLLETWVEKCTFKDEVTVLCAVPREVTDYSGADPRFITSPDDVYQVNVTSGRITLVGSPVSDLKMENLRLSTDQSLLYFTDQQGQLHSMRLK